MPCASSRSTNFPAGLFSSPHGDPLQVSAKLSISAVRKTEPSYVRLVPRVCGEIPKRRSRHIAMVVVAVTPPPCRYEPRARAAVQPARSTCPDLAEQRDAASREKTVGAPTHISTGGDRPGCGTVHSPTAMADGGTCGISVSMYFSPPSFRDLLESAPSV
jgi:hypothetical protein